MTKSLVPRETRLGGTPSGDSSVNESPYEGFEVGTTEVVGNQKKNAIIYKQVALSIKVQDHRLTLRKAST